MHPYSTNSPAHPNLYGVLGIVALAGSLGSSYLAHQLHLFGWSVGGISAMALFAALFLLFDRVLWRWKMARVVLLVPDLNGEWTCAGNTTLKNGNDVAFPWSATITIQQSWSKIAIVLKTSQSESQSIAASLYRDGGHRYRLIYHYDNTPAASESDLHRHAGLADLMFEENLQTATGSYFTGKDRLTVGTMRLERKK